MLDRVEPSHSRTGGSRNNNAGDARGTSGIATLNTSFHQGYESTQPPEPLLNALLHNDCTGKVPVDKLMSAAAPCPEEIQAHLSPFSAPPESSHPPFGNWSVIVSAISCPPTIVIPALGPRPLKLAPQLAPASVMYGRFVYAMLPYDELVALCHAQYCVPNPLALFPCAVAITYCTLALLEEVVLPKCAAAFTASAASCDWEGCEGAAEALSYQTSAKMP